MCSSVVGDTTGDLEATSTGEDADDRVRLPHGGDVFVAALTTRSGERLWLSQLEPARGAVPGAELCAQPDGRGRCGIAIDAETGAAVVTGSTTGWIAKTEDDADEDDDDAMKTMAAQYRETCGAARARTLVGGTCLQLFVARLALATGDVSWVHQLLDATHTTSDAVLLLRPPSDAKDKEQTKEKDVVVLGTADAGLVSDERMEQLVLRRLSGTGAVVRWTRELGLAGEDHGVALQAPTSKADGLGLGLGAGRGRRQPPAVAWRDDAAHDPVDITHQLVELQLRRATPRCAGPLTVPYRLDGPAARLLSALAATGSVVFRDDQETAALVLAVPSSLSLAAMEEPLALRVELQPTDVVAIDGAGSVTVAIGGRTNEPPAPAPAPASRAADGRLWRELSSVFSLATALALLLVVLVGRFCWRRCLRRAKVFQYKMIRLRRRRSSQQQDAHDAVAKALGMVPVRSSALRPQHQQQQKQKHPAAATVTTANAETAVVVS
ncbi:hypothetical protein PINS_up006805 [Pythium insidiosum]|nr:hypothetical protein PINS_up006805 [Pythium insidiosum]